MLGGAVAVLLTGQIAPSDALSAINVDVMVFLFGMFVVGEALSLSGYLDSVFHRLFRHARTTGELVFCVIFSFGVLSALLMNDTLAIIGTPLVLGLATRCRVLAKMLLLALAFAITTGSVVSPIGNPQNLLVAVNSGMNAPFVTFGTFLLNSPRHLSARSNQQSQKFPQLHPRQRSDQCPDASPQKTCPPPRSCHHPCLPQFHYRQKNPKTKRRLFLWRVLPLSFSSLCSQLLVSCQ